MPERFPVLTRGELLARLYRHIPRGIGFDDRSHDFTVETRRLACAQEAAALACGKGIVPVPDNERVAIDPEVQRVIDALRAWKLFGERCERAFPDREVWDESGPFFDPGYRYTVARAGYVHPPQIFHRIDDEPPGAVRPRPKPTADVRDPVICVVSILAPVFAIVTHIHEPKLFTGVRYHDFPERYHDRIDTLSAIAEETFGFHRLDKDILLTPTPDLQPYTSNRPMEKMTMADCLFTPSY